MSVAGQAAFRPEDEMTWHLDRCPTITSLLAIYHHGWTRPASGPDVSTASPKSAPLQPVWQLAFEDTANDLYAPDT